MSPSDPADDVTALLGAAPPAELGVLSDRHAHRRHLAGTMLDLAARGHLRLVDAGNDPTVGWALDWYLQLPGELAPTGIDATDRAAVASARPTPEPALPGPAVAITGREADTVPLRPHELAFLDIVADTPSRLLSRVRASPGLPAVLDVVMADVVARGWLRRWRAPVVRTRVGRAMAVQLRAARADLDAHSPASEMTGVLLPQAVALGLTDLWTARLGQQRPPPPAWFEPGPSRTARGWLGVCNAAKALAVAPPPGGGAGSGPGASASGGYPMG